MRKEVVVAMFSCAGSSGLVILLKNHLSPQTQSMVSF